ncbi:hypothetical protein NEF87_003353 [Candidatus Lokiarchaeum ossiferum]|uniref:ABM domain-containing protein n=1 Tax=Candidatus Lokiarchaeum ossiferum TaxID=2951803 RepID=A0ABY6HU72_9ARCH|nr:hypothetical protein NEF87_003353 [Candidatus Lokiarchaeum sp. B-35]
MKSLPFIEVSIVHSQDPKKEILKFLQQKAEGGNNSQVNFIENGENMKIFVEYKSERDFQNTYHGEKKIYEKFYQLIQENVSDYANLLETVLTKPTPKDFYDEEDLEENDLYLIVKYRTNYKEIIRQNYNFTFKIIEILGIKASFEEIADGFLLFYKTKEDFEVAQMDLKKLELIQAFLKKKGLWNEKIQFIFKNLE